MAIARYLAMTADELASTPEAPQRIAWMACHFSPYSTSLSNLPQKLPANSLLILNDSTPPERQNPEIIAKELDFLVKEQDCSGILLDFQRSDCSQSRMIAQELQRINCPVCVSMAYAKGLDCPVFLPPVPITTPLQDYIAPWKNREIWLDTALTCGEFTVTKDGSSYRPIATAPECTLADHQLHCHYCISIKDDAIIFTLQRTRDDLDALINEAETLGIAATVGLYQELK